MSVESRYAIYLKRTLRELELELTIFIRDLKSCSIPQRRHFLMEHIEFLERMITKKRTTP